MPEPSNNSWGEYSRLVLAELERHNRLIEQLGEKVADIKGEIATRNELQSLKTEFAEYKASTTAELATLRTKASSWGALAGAIGALIPLLITLAIQLLQHKPK